jgi:hypothetical protein
LKRGKCVDKHKADENQSDSDDPAYGFKWRGADGMPAHEMVKVRATLYLPRDVLDAARNAVVFLAGPPARLTLTKLAEDALRAELERLKERYNNGREFPARDEELRGGRPIAA